MQFIKGFTHLGSEAQEELAAVTVRQELPRGHVLTEGGAVCRHIWFIEQGLARTFYVKNGKDVTDWLSPEGTISCSIVSFLTRQPDIRTIELLEPSVVHALPREGLEQLYDRFHEIERLGRLLVSWGLIQLQQRFDELHFATARQRYQRMMAAHPSLLNRVPLGMIASYLGITQETLSRMRRRP